MTDEKMENRKKGDLIKIPTLEELESDGWLWYNGGTSIYHPDLSVVNYRMGEDMQKYFGKTVTLIGIDLIINGHNLYGIEEDNENWRWCFDFFDERRPLPACFFNHEEGMTPIDGWFICKTCGTNLREIK